MSRQTFKTWTPAHLCINIKANIQDTDTCPSLRWVLHLLTPSTTSRQRSKTWIPTRLCSGPFIINNVKTKIQDVDTHPSLRRVPHLLTPSTHQDEDPRRIPTCLCCRPFITCHHRQRQDENQRQVDPSALLSRGSHELWEGIATPS